MCIFGRLNSMSEQARSKIRIYLQNSLILIFCIFAACSLLLQFDIRKLDYNLSSVISESIRQFKLCFIHSSTGLTVIAASLFYISLKLKKIILPHRYLFYLFSFIVAILWLMGKGFQKPDISILYKPACQLPKSVVYVLGSYWLVHICLKMLYIIFNKEFIFPPYIENTYKKFKSHPYLITVLILLVAWIPSIIITYPGNVMIDSWESINSYWRTIHITDRQPITFAVLIGVFTHVGKILGDPNLGIFLFILFQMIVYIAIICYSIKLILDLNAPWWLTFLYLLTVCFSPYYANRVNLVLKDNFYSICFSLFIIEIIWLLILKEKFFKTFCHPVFFILSTLVVYLLRHNGKYVLIPSFIILFIWTLCLYKNEYKSHFFYLKKLIFTLLIPILLGISINTYLNKHYHVTRGNIGEALCFPIQQTARYIKLYPNDVEDYEKKAISKILPYDKIADSYVPDTSENIKDLFNVNASKEDILNYLKIWFIMMFKHPITYVNANFHQNFRLFFPFLENDMVYNEFFPFVKEFYDPLFEKIGFHDVDVSTNMKQLLQQYYYASYSFPVIGVLSSPPLYILISILMLIFSLIDRIKPMITIMVPIMLSILVCFMAPTTVANPRFSFPIIYSFWFVLSYYLYLNNSKKLQKFKKS